MGRRSAAKTGKPAAPSASCPACRTTRPALHRIPVPEGPIKLDAAYVYVCDVCFGKVRREQREQEHMAHVHDLLVGANPWLDPSYRLQRAAAPA